jgi:HAD superfamily hydrolase (TIGR01509 family)
MIDPAEVRAVLFDVGQTLLYPDLHFLQKLLADFGAQTDFTTLARSGALARERVSRTKGNERNYSGFFSFWMKSAGAKEEVIPDILKQIYERHQREHLWNWLDPEAPSTLAGLRGRGYRLGIISNADGQIAGAMEKLQLAQYFDHMIDSALVGVEKPDQRIFAMALEKLQLPGKACLYVGDHYDNDVLGARNAGLVPVLLDPFDVVIEDDVERIRQLSDLLRLLPGKVAL